MIEENPKTAVGVVAAIGLFSFAAGSVLELVSHDRELKCKVRENDVLIKKLEEKNKGLQLTVSAQDIALQLSNWEFGNLKRHTFTKLDRIPLLEANLVSVTKERDRLAISSQGLDRLHDLSLAYRDLQHRLHGVGGELTAANLNLAQSIGQCDTVRAALETEIEKKRTALRECEESKAAGVASTARLMSQRVAILFLHGQLQELQRQLDVSNNQSDVLQLDVERAEGERQELGSALRASNSKAVSLAADLAKLRVELERETAARVALEGDVDALSQDLQQERGQHTATIARQQEVIRLQHIALQSKNLEVDRLLRVVQHADARHGEGERLRAGLQQELLVSQEYLYRTNATCRHQIVGLRRELDTKTQQVDDLLQIRGEEEAIKRGLVARLQQLEAELGSSKDRLEMKERMCDHLSDQLSAGVRTELVTSLVQHTLLYLDVADDLNVEITKHSSGHLEDLEHKVERLLFDLEGEQLRAGDLETLLEVSKTEHGAAIAAVTALETKVGELEQAISTQHAVTLNLRLTKAKELQIETAAKVAAEREAASLREQLKESQAAKELETEAAGVMAKAEELAQKFSVVGLSLEGKASPVVSSVTSPAADSSVRERDLSAATTQSSGSSSPRHNPSTSSMLPYAFDMRAENDVMAEYSCTSTSLAAAAAGLEVTHTPLQKCQISQVRDMVIADHHLSKCQHTIHTTHAIHTAVCLGVRWHQQHHHLYPHMQEDLVSYTAVRMGGRLDKLCLISTKGIHFLMREI